MTQIEEEEVICHIQCQKQTPIFDSDNLTTEMTQSKKQINNQPLQIIEKQMIISNNNQTILETQQNANNLNSKLNEELENTNENFFKIVNQKPTGKKLTKIIHNSSKNEKILNCNSNSVLKTGFMQKKTDAIIFKWKRRFFVLTPEKLFFFEDEKRQNVIGCVNIKLIGVKVFQKNEQITLDFLGDCENIILRCYTQYDTKQWLQWLQQVVKFQSSSNKLLLKTINKPLYNENNTISEKQFINEASTGDILLFYTNHIGAQLQRGITNSEFDHVAMVVKFRNNQLMVFQSNQATGVSIFEWNKFIRCFNLYQKVTFRKLNSPRKPQIEHKLLNFVKVNLGRKFQLNISKLVTFQSDFDWQKVNDDVKRGYFCSQLVAKAYKGAGLLNPIKSSCRYWPVDFSQKSNMKLERGAFFDQQQAIILNKHLKKVL